MGAWLPTQFKKSDGSLYGDMSDWDNVGDFDMYYQDTHFWWSAYARNGYIAQYDNGCAILMIIDKINSMNGNGVTMSAIIQAMLSATFDELQYFIGLVDAYRMTLWNAPFNAEFYAALARGFEKWPQY